MTPMWLVGQYTGGDKHAMQGIFDSKDLAVAACRTEMYWVMELPLNGNLPHDEVKDIPCWYPLLEPEPEKV